MRPDADLRVRTQGERGETERKVFFLLMIVGYQNRVSLALVKENNVKPEDTRQPF